MKLSLAFTTWNSASWIKQQLSRDFFSLSNNLIDEIIIQDDNSPDYAELTNHTTDKIKLYKNDENLSPLLSREKLVKNCKNDWILLMDSDNFLRKTSDFGKDCFEVIQNLDFNDNTIYCPGFKAHPLYGNLCDQIIDLDFACTNFDDPAYYMKVFLNTGNYLIPRKRYLDICKQIDKSYAHFTVDVVYFNYLWLKAGNKLHCVSNYEYDHNIRDGCYSFTHGDRSQTKLQEVYSFYRNYKK